MMAAWDALPVSEVLFLFFTGRGGSFLSQKEKEKNGGAKKRADRVVRPYNRCGGDLSPSRGSHRDSPLLAEGPFHTSGA